MRSFIVMLALTMPAFCFAQIKTSTCSERWQTVSAPARAIQINPWTVADHYSLSGRWGYPFDTPNPAGVFEISNAIVDQQQKIGAWSQPKTLSVKSGWRLNGGSWNQAASYDDAGIAWKIKVVATEQPDPKWPVGKEYFLTANFESDATSWFSLAPWSSTTPTLQQLRWLTYNEQYFNLGNMACGGSHTAVAPPPIVYATQMQLVNHQIAYCYETNNGETALSPPAQFTVPAIYNGWTAANTCQYGAMLQDPLPMGALGFRIYVKTGSNQWRRLPAPHCIGVPDPNNADDWRWQPDNQMIVIDKAVSSNYPAHSPAVNPQSWFTKLQAAMYDNPGKSIEVDDPENVLYCPVIHDLDIGGVSNVGRKIAGSGDGRFKVKQANAGYWPAWVNYSSYTKVIGLDVDSQGSAALAFASPTGSCSFGCVFQDCNLVCRERTDGQLTQAMRVREACAGVGGHSASELQFVGCNLNAPVAIWVEHIQTANLQFDRTHAASNYAANRRNSVVWANSPNTLKFKNGAYFDCPNNVIFNTCGANLIVDELWVDNGFFSLYDCHNAASSLKINTGKLNVRTRNTGKQASLVRQFNTQLPSTCKFNDIVTQFDPDTPAKLQSLSYRCNRLNMLYDGGNLGDSMTLREPTASEAQTEANARYGVGNAPNMDFATQIYRVAIPDRTIPPVVGVVGAPSVVVPGTTVYMNSFTSGQIVRIPWKQ